MKIRKISFSANEFSIIRNIRKDIFSDEMGISELEIFDKFDKMSAHFLFTNHNHVIGSVRLRQIGNNMKLERMAIYEKFREQNFGHDAVRQIIDYYILFFHINSLAPSVFLPERFAPSVKLNVLSRVNTFKVLLPESFRGGCSFGATKCSLFLKNKLFLLYYVK